MNKEILKKAGFEEEVKRVNQGCCPLCKSPIISLEDFRDEESEREFEISGMCQKCQDKIFEK